MSCYIYFSSYFCNCKISKNILYKMKKITFAAFFLLTFCIGFLQTAVAQNKSKNKEVRVEMVTTEGRMVFVLFNDTPLHRDNFLKLVESHTYDSLLFHRVINR